MTMTAPRMREVIEALKHSNLRDKVRVMVGGAPITRDFANSIGADGYAPDAVSALDKAKELLGQLCLVVSTKGGVKLVRLCRVKHKCADGQ